MPRMESLEMNYRLDTFVPVANNTATTLETVSHNLHYSIPPQPSLKMQQTLHLSLMLDMVSANVRVHVGKTTYAFGTREPATVRARSPNSSSFAITPLSGINRPMVSTRPAFGQLIPGFPKISHQYCILGDSLSVYSVNTSSE